MGTVQAESGKAPRFKTEFKDHLLLEVSGK
jgi:hypothetical protein